MSTLARGGKWTRFAGICALWLISVVPHPSYLKFRIPLLRTHSNWSWPNSPWQSATSQLRTLTVLKATTFWFNILVQPRSLDLLLFARRMARLYRGSATLILVSATFLVMQAMSLAYTAAPVSIPWFQVAMPPYPTFTLATTASVFVFSMLAILVY